MNNLAKARDALPPSGWSACGVHGRPLSTKDFSALAELGIGDRFFVWEREVQAPEYYMSLLQFRIEHYGRYGFGVHGIWIEEQLVGQCGLQVLDAELDRIEFAIFLGRRWKHNGLGTCLARFLIEKCSKAGINELYAIVRSDNPEALGMIRRIEGVDRGGIRHFGQAARMFVISLKKDN